MSIRTYHDPLHGSIRLDSNKSAELMVMNLIDSSPFQRLRRIRQLGPAYLTFHGAESSRFTHSIGVFHIARKIFSRFLLLDKNIESYRGILYASALLHDIGHGPLSHTGECIFGIQHEEWSAKITREHPQIKKILESYSVGTCEKVSDLLEGKIQDMRPIKSLISSQLDCDRLDYLLRDSYATGTCYGNLDLERIISALTLAPDGDLAIMPKGLMAVEHYLTMRNLMYRSVYNHRLNNVCNWILEKILDSARSLGPQNIWADHSMSEWIWNPDEIKIENFLQNDDIRTSYHIMRWKEEGPSIISELCERFLNRNLLKAIQLKNQKNECHLEVLSIARQLSELQGINPDQSCGIFNQLTNGYQPYRSGLRLWDGVNLTALEKNSPLIQSLIKTISSTWLIYPREISSQLEQRIGKINDMNYYSSINQKSNGRRDN